MCARALVVCVSECFRVCVCMYVSVCLCVSECWCVCVPRQALWKVLEKYGVPEKNVECCKVFP